MRENTECQPGLDSVFGEMKEGRVGLRGMLVTREGSRRRVSRKEWMSVCQTDKERQQGINRMNEWYCLKE